MLAGRLTAAQAALLAAAGPEAVRLALLAASARIAALGRGAPSPSTPSGAVPPHLKPAAKRAGRRKKKPGAKDGHPGSRRKPPPEVDARAEHRLPACPCCGGELQRCERTRTRIIEYIPREATPVVTEHTIHRDYCPSCRKHVEPVVPDAMPGAALGHHVVALSSWFHYGLGVTIGQTRDILGSHLHAAISAGGLVDAWGRMAGALRPWYEQIAEQLRDTACLHADETGWTSASSVEPRLPGAVEEPPGRLRGPDLHRPAVQLQPQLRGVLGRDEGEARLRGPPRQHPGLHRLHAAAVRRTRPRRNTPIVMIARS